MAALHLHLLGYWVNEFKRDQASTSNESRSGRPIEITTPEMVEKIHRRVVADRRVKLRETAEVTGISYERAQNIFSEHLHMKK